jgi:hypothetical protein
MTWSSARLLLLLLLLLEKCSPAAAACWNRPFPGPNDLSGGLVN